MGVGISLGIGKMKWTRARAHTHTHTHTSNRAGLSLGNGLTFTSRVGLLPEDILLYKYAQGGGSVLCFHGRL